MGWVILILIASLFALPLVPWILQRRGVAWAYKVGFPVATYWQDGPTDAIPSDKLILDEREDTVLVRERHPVELFKWPAGVVGRIEKIGQRTRLQFVTDWHTSVVWFATAFQGSAVLFVLFFAPEIRDPATSWTGRIGLFLMAAAVAGLAAGIVRWMRRRARTKSNTYASTLGFA